MLSSIIEIKPIFPIKKRQKLYLHYDFIVRFPDPKLIGSPHLIAEMEIYPVVSIYEYYQTPRVSLIFLTVHPLTVR